MGYTPQTTDQLPQYESGKHWTSEPAGSRPIVKSATGEGAIEATTVWKSFKQVLTNPQGDSLALKGCDGKTWTYKEYYADSVKAAKSFMHLGVQQFESVSIIGFNAPQWNLAFLGALATGSTGAGIYTTSAAEACKYIVEHSKARVICVEDAAQLKKFTSYADDLDSLVALVNWGAMPEGAVEADGKFTVEGCKKPVYSWDQFIALGAGVADADVDARVEAQLPEHCCSLIYTSGTTGAPKAVMISNDNATWTVKSLLVSDPALEAFRKAGKTHRIVSYLPLSHVAAQVIDIMMPITMVGSNEQACEVHFARPDAMRGSLKDTLGAVRPTFFFGVPRVWEKFAAAIKAIGATNKGLKKALSTWAKGTALDWYRSIQNDSTTKAPMMWGLARTILKKVKVSLGLDQAIILATGAAPIKHETLEYLGSLGLPVQEVYGMSECTGPVTLVMSDWIKMGSCGMTLPGMEVKIMHDPARDKADEGEICFRGRHIMMGYMHGAAQTEETIDSDGYLHSGDVGRLDEKTGMLFITGRIKELIITAGGENIAPVPIEDALAKLMPGISNLMVVGDKKKFNTVLITLPQEGDVMSGWTSDSIPQGPAWEVSDVRTIAAAKSCPKWDAYVKNAIAEYNKTAVSNAQKIQKHAILDNDLSVEGGELTGTLKLKRKVVSEASAAVIDAMYGPEE